MVRSHHRLWFFTLGLSWAVAAESLGQQQWPLPGGVDAAAPPPYASTTQYPVAGPLPLDRPSYPAATPPAPRPEPDPSRLFEPAKIIAFVGDLPILAGDVLPTVNQALEPHLDQMPPEQIAQQRERLMQEALEPVIERKLLFQEFRRFAPEDRRAQIRFNLSKEFDEKQLDEMIDRAKVATAAELDAELRKYGSSIQKQKEAFIERQLGGAMAARNIDMDREATHQEMLDYYWEHLQDYEYPAKATWEQLTVRFAKFPDKDAARQALCWMGNQVLSGASFAEVARRHSLGVNAEQGGFHDWTTQGSLASNVLDHAIFTMPIGEMSPILEDERGYHIIRVMGRKEAGRKPFTEAQEEIKEHLRKKWRQEEYQAYLARLRRKTRIWTVFDEPQSMHEAPASRVSRDPRFSR